MYTDKIELMTINTFPVTQANREQYLLCKEVMLHPECYRLIFFHLPSHESFHLKNALLNFWGTGVNCRSITTGEFIADLLESIHKGTWYRDLDCYAEPDILLVDDLQHLAGKESSQTEFYRIILKKRMEQKKLTVLFSALEIGQLQSVMTDELIHFLNLALRELPL